ncbi:MAG: hypothetical protein ACO1O6_06920 [Bacteroidota bacterium]
MAENNTPFPDSIKEYRVISDKSKNLFERIDKVRDLDLPDEAEDELREIQYQLKIMWVKYSQQFEDFHNGTSENILSAEMKFDLEGKPLIDDFVDQLDKMATEIKLACKNSGKE